MKLINGKEHISEIILLIGEYTEELGRDLSFQDIDSEFNDPFEKYSPPNGDLIAAEENGEIVGMAAYKRLSDTRAEMKRLYVKQKYRKSGVGKMLAEEIISRAENTGYKEIVLDTIEPLRAAVMLYKNLGFTECEPYYYNPMNDVIYMKKELK